ncbi:MAG: hypothetical protein ABI607_07295 [Betaproteobacteria bacterium]
MPRLLGDGEVPLGHLPFTAIPSRLLLEILTPQNRFDYRFTFSGRD